MMHILDYAEQVRSTARCFRQKMPEHQRLVYAIEAVVNRALPSLTVDAREAQSYIDAVCLEEGCDSPDVIVRKIRSFDACASHEAHAIVLGSGETSRMTLCHELAHLLCPVGEGHHEQWRSTFVRLARRYVSVEHGALLHSLYNRLDLPAQW